MNIPEFGDLQVINRYPTKCGTIFEIEKEDGSGYKLVYLGKSGSLEVESLAVSSHYAPDWTAQQTMLELRL